MRVRFNITISASFAASAFLSSMLRKGRTPKLRTPTPNPSPKGGGGQSSNMV